VGGIDVIAGCEGFDWDAGNAAKIWERHRVSPVECERVFFNRPIAVSDDLKHSEDEVRYCALGRSDTGRNLFVVFTIRAGAIRVFSARDMSRKERRAYEVHEKEAAEVQK